MYNDALALGPGKPGHFTLFAEFDMKLPLNTFWIIFPGR
jgi:hypothetical protein